mgnify:CR=1 FL=1
MRKILEVLVDNNLRKALTTQWTHWLQMPFQIKEDLRGMSILTKWSTRLRLHRHWTFMQTR